MPACYTNTTQPALTTWDTGVYPYYLVSFIYEKGKTEWNRVRLTYAAQPFEYSDGTIKNSGNCYFTEYSNGSWDSYTLELEAGEMSYKPGLNDDVFMRIWTSHDITGYMKAGGITPGAFLVNHKDLWTGVAFGLAGKGIPAELNKDPIAYLYNGVQLPPLPEVDGKTKAYLYKVTAIGITRYHIVLISEPYYAISSNGSYSIGHRPGDVEYLAKESALEWNQSVVWEANGLDVATDNVLWANFDILNENGGIVLAKSDPVPVYE